MLARGLFRRAVEAFAPSPPHPLTVAVERILGGAAPNELALDLGLDGETTREASRRAHVLKPRAKVRRRRKTATRCW